jgi:hypothetical protein
MFTMQNAVLQEVGAQAHGLAVARTALDVLCRVTRRGQSLLHVTPFEFRKAQAKVQHTPKHTQQSLCDAALALR